MLECGVKSVPLVQLKSTEKIKARRDIVTLLHHLSCGVEQLIYNTLRWVKSRSILCPSEPVFSLMCNHTLSFSLVRNSSSLFAEN